MHNTRHLRQLQGTAVCMHKELGSMNIRTCRLSDWFLRLTDCWHIPQAHLAKANVCKVYCLAPTMSISFSHDDFSPASAMLL